MGGAAIPNVFIDGSCVCGGGCCLDTSLLSQEAE